MPAAHGGDAATTLSRKVGDVLDFLDGFGLDIELRRGMKCPRPGRLGVVCNCAKGY